jgi:hypothetical protein
MFFCPLFYHQVINELSDSLRSGGEVQEFAAQLPHSPRSEAEGGIPDTVFSLLSKKITKCLIKNKKCGENF